MSRWRLGARLRLLTRLRSEYRALNRRIERSDRDLGDLRASLATISGLPMTAVGEVLVAAQREVTKHAPTDVYADSYRAEETLYWLHLPGWFAEWAARAAPRRVLDIGSGYGTFSVFASLLTSSESTCVDIAPERIAPSLAAAHGLRVVGANIELSDPPDPPYDAVVMTEVLEHFNFAPVPTVRRIRDALRPGGRLFLSTPDADSWGRVEDSYADWRDMPPADPEVPTLDRHVYQFSADELTTVLAESGLRIVRLDRAPGRWGFHLNVEAEPG